MNEARSLLVLSGYIEIIETVRLQMLRAKPG
jgi:hypothetical protein